MGFAGMISRDFIDKDIGDGNSYGWSPISPILHYTPMEQKIAKSLGITRISEVSNIENIVFYKKPSDNESNIGKTNLIYKWRYITERRLNILLQFKRNLVFQGSKLSLQASISETERAHENVINILSETAEAVVVSKEKDHSDDDFEQVFAGELLSRLLLYGKTITDASSARDIVADMKYLTAVILQRKDEDNEYVCSISEYVNFLRELDVRHIDQECDDCRIETVFTDYQYCLVCGRRF